MTMIEPKIKPGRSWFVAGGGLILVGIVVGVVLLVAGIMSAVDKLPEFTAQVKPGSQQSVEISTAGTWALYAGGSNATSAGGSCTIKAPTGGTVATRKPSSSMSFTRDSRQWYWIATFTVNAPGTYQFTCVGMHDIDAFAIGEEPDTAGFVTGLVGSIVGMMAFFCGGPLIGLTIIIVTVVRRSTARKRLQRMTYPSV